MYIIVLANFNHNIQQYNIQYTPLYRLRLTRHSLNEDFTLCYKIAIFARWKTFAPKHSKTVLLKQHNVFFLNSFIHSFIAIVPLKAGKLVKLTEVGRLFQITAFCYDVWCLTVFVCSNCSPLNFVHLSHSVKHITALLIASCDRLSQIACNAFWVRWLIWVLDGACNRPTTSRPYMVVHDSGWFRRIWRPLIVSDEFEQ